jgi:biotin operon repressor
MNSVCWSREAADPPRPEKWRIALSEEQRLSPEIQRFIDAIGEYFAQFGLSGVSGRLLGLMMVADEPLTLDDMAEALSVSRASISTNIRLIKAIGFVDKVSMPRDRRDFYRCSSDPWGAVIRTDMVSTDMLAGIARRGLLAIPEDASGTARAHVEDLLDFCEFMLEEERGILQRWRQRVATRMTANIPSGVQHHDQDH